MEISQTERRRLRLYSDLIVHFQLQRRPEEFDSEAFSRHVADRARLLLRNLRGNEADVEFLRRLLQEQASRLREAWSKVQTPLVPAAHNPYFEDSLRASLELERQDAKVVTDFVLWAAAPEPVGFVTTDSALLRLLRGGFQAFVDSRLMPRPRVGDFLEPDRFLAGVGS